MIIKTKSYFATAFFTRMVFPGFSLSLSFPCFYSFLSCSALFFFLSCSALSRTSTDTGHNLTICTQKATRFNKKSRRSRCCGQAGYSLRASTKIRTAAGVAVKLATACKTTKKTRCFFTKAAAFSRLTKFIRLSDRSEPEFDASVHSRAVVRG